ncbi:hypothetical protein BGZ60DRAFT_563636 [Tricladium varicosporioides]|nr:hypothetical protein BGZ60DRAFT_563636 [Hymenoscyphus varicosporioides]
MLLPPFSSLPLKKDGPRGNAWGLFSDKDELGMLNLLTPETTRAAAQEIVHGIRISTDCALDKPKAPCFNRASFAQVIHTKSPRSVNDDILTLNTQSSSQWDGFRHYGYQDAKLYFNGCSQDEVHNSLRNGTHVWVENGGIVGRGVLLDYCSWAESQGCLMPPLETSEITVSDLEKVAEFQDVQFKEGDILFIRSGYTRALEAMDLQQATTYASNPPPKAIGVKSNEETLKWVWEHHFAAVAGDALAWEALPMQSEEYSIHQWMLAGWGLPIGELFDLEKLSTECKKHKKWTFFFSSMPLKVPGGVASPPNGVAIL